MPPKKESCFRSFSDDFLEALGDARIKKALQELFSETIEELITDRLQVLTDEYVSLKKQVEDQSIEIANLKGRQNMPPIASGSIDNVNNVVGPGSDLNSIADIITKSLINADKEKDDMKRRSLNVIISGLAPSPHVSDTALLEQFMEQNLTVKPHIVSTKRLGQSRGTTGEQSKLPKLCVTLESAENVNNLLDSSSMLRSSSNQNARRVYFNRDLNRAQREAAYEARCLRRSRRPATTQGSSNSDQVPASLGVVNLSQVDTASTQPFSD